MENNINFLEEVLAGMKDRIPHEERALLMTKTLDLLRELEVALKNPTDFSFDRFYFLVDAIGEDYERWQASEFETDSYTFAQRFLAAWSYVEASCFMLAAVSEVDKQDQLFVDLAKVAETETLQMLGIFAPNHKSTSGSNPEVMDLTDEEWGRFAPLIENLSKTVVEACIDIDEGWDASDLRKVLDEFKSVFDYQGILGEYASKRVGMRYQAKPSLVKAVLRLEVAIWLRQKGYDWQIIESCLNGAAGLLSRVYTAEVVRDRI